MKRFLFALGLSALAASAARADSITVQGSHEKRKPTDPVTVTFEKFQVKKAKFDPKKIEGGSAEIEVDLTSLKTDSAKRDGDLKSPAYLDVAKFGTMTIAIANVKKKADKTYSADATVNIKGVTAKFPVTFDVVEATADSIHVKGEHAFTRKDIKLGKDEGDPVAQGLQIAVDLTLKNTP
ncbi:MAG TPA: YceI family protein [Haliangiales bacterium]|nr:YceI family protein [Haliangiales bacterium]